MFNQPLFWRVTSTYPKVGPLDARLMALVALFVFWFNIVTFFIMVVGFAVHFALLQKGISLNATVRFLKTGLSGRVHTQRGFQYRRLPVDYGFETPEVLEAARLRYEAMDAQSHALHEKLTKGKHPMGDGFQEA